MSVPASMKSDIEHIHETVRAAGGRLTTPTRMVISILASSDAHLTADDLIAAVEQRMAGVSGIPGVAPSTIYRVIQRLGDLGVIEHVHSGSGPAFYHLRARGHAHLVCNTCGVVIDLPDQVFEGLTKVARDRYGFSIDAHHSALLGLCAACSSALRR